MRVCILFIALTLAVTSARRRGGEYKINIIIGHKTQTSLQGNVMMAPSQFVLTGRGQSRAGEVSLRAARTDPTPPALMGVSLRGHRDPLAEADAAPVTRG